MLEYKGYLGHVEFDDEAEVFHGEVINTRDVITFQGTSVDGLHKAFIESVDDYLDFCSGYPIPYGFDGFFCFRDIEPPYVPIIFRFINMGNNIIYIIDRSPIQVEFSQVIHQVGPGGAMIFISFT